MKGLTELLKEIHSLEIKGDSDIGVTSLSFNSKTIEQGALFVALVGNATDGHTYIGDAIENGAKVIVYEKEPESFKDGVIYIKVLDTHDTVGKLASAFYDHPSEHLKLIGITGTNGKTTTATLLHQLFRNLGQKAGMIGTIANKINDKSIDALHTTPDPITLNKLLKEMVDDGCDYCFMEVSSHAVVEKRISGLFFSGGVFTNLTLDHLDYHKTIENYRDAKKAFFDNLTEEVFVLSNLDDPNGAYMLSSTKAKKYFYSLKQDADFTERLETKLIGEFNAYNALAIYGTAVLLDEDRGKVQTEMKNLEPVEGRFQYIKSTTGVIGIVDYAHTPDALENVLKTIQELCVRQDLTQSKIISVIGCGGDRDKTKRPIMAKIGYDMSDVLILTSDNPRTEKPEDILRDMEAGLPDIERQGLSIGALLPNNKKVYIMPDRREAIKKAVERAVEGDYILVAGKGHEKYQEVNGVKNHFDDMEELKKNFND